MANKYFDPEIELRPIKFLANYYASKLGEIWQWKNNDWHLLEPYFKGKYYHVSVFTLDMEWKQYAVHRLVAFAWLGNPPELGTHCCHRNDVPIDNKPDNLYWGNDLTNSQDYHENKNTRLYKEGQKQIKLERELAKQSKRVSTTNQVNRTKSPKPSKRSKEEQIADRIAKRIARAKEFLSNFEQSTKEQP